MKDISEQRRHRWQQLLVGLNGEYRALSSCEKARIAALLAAITRLQRSLDLLFRKAGGEQTCSSCAGACCAKGHNHACLPTLLAYLQRGMTPPQADFSATCPWLGAQGCVLAVDFRPYSCITFLCGKLEQSLTAADLEEFYTLEKELRQCYLAFAERYAGGGMSGLLIQSERLADRPLLALKAG